MPWVDLTAVERVASILRDLEFEVDPFTDPRYYPPASASREVVVSYFVVMVAMDHRLSRPGRPYEARVGGELYHGADLLYRLGVLMLEEDPEFFTPRRLSRIGSRDVLEWLCVGGVCPPDPDVRAFLLRDLGLRTLRLYGDSFAYLLDAAGDRLRGAGGEGLVDVMRGFAAYGDPVEKKIMLLAKFLERRGALKIVDEWNKRVPVDNHVTRIALRLGIVGVEEWLRSKLLRREGFEWWEDVLLRMAVREAWWLVSRRAGVDPFVLDDLLWGMGRKTCVRGRPMCTRCSGRLGCGVGGECVFRRACPTGLGSAPVVDEHLFLNTWWY